METECLVTDTDFLSPREQRAETIRCLHDPLHFVLTYCKTIDDSGDLKEIPNWPHVRKAIRDFHASRGKVLESLYLLPEDDDEVSAQYALYPDGFKLHIGKSRQLLLSWLACAYILWALMYERNFAAFVGSRVQELVDDGGQESTHESLLGRIRHLWNHVPTFARCEVDFAFLKITCKSRGGVIKGSTSNESLGRGGTYQFALLDEWAFFKKSELAFGAISRACPVGLVELSTPNGPANNHARIRKLRPPGWVFREHRWETHPVYGAGLYYGENGESRSPWFDFTSADMSPTAVARELRISYEESVEGQIYPQFNYVRHAGRLDVEYDANLPLCIGVDFGIGAKTAAIFFQMLGKEVRCLLDYEMTNVAAPEHAANLWSLAQKLGYEGLQTQVQCYGDPAGNSRELATGSTVIREYQAAGFRNFTTKRMPLLDGIRITRSKFMRGEIFVSAACEFLPDRLVSYHFKVDDFGRPTDVPEHDDSSHMCDALRYAIVCNYNIETTPYIGGAQDHEVEKVARRVTRRAESPSLIRGRDEYEGRFASMTRGRKF